MPYKLLTSVFVAVLFVVIDRPVLEAQFVEPPILGFRDRVSSLTGSIRTAAIRSDGRYLFYARSSTSWTALDLEDGVTQSPVALNVQGSLITLLLASDNQLLAVTSRGIQYFDITEPFDPEEESTDYDRPSTASGSVIDACIDRNQRVAILESPFESSKTLLRLVSNKSELSSVSKSSVFTSRPGDYVPLKLFCTSDSIVLMALRTSTDDDDEVYLVRFPLGSLSGSSSLNVSQLETAYMVKDIVASTDGSRLWILFNKTTASGNRTDDSILRSITPASLSVSSRTSVGSDGRALAPLQFSGSHYLGAFMGKDTLESLSSPPSHQFLVQPQGSIRPGIDFGDRGVGYSEAGSFSVTSRWWSTSKDHYHYGSIDSAGLVRVSAAPRIELTEEIDSLVVSDSSTIDFSLQSDVDVNYSIYFNKDKPLEGSRSGISETPGRLVTKGSFQKSDSPSFSIPVSNLFVEKIGTYSLLIVARQRGAPEGDARFPTARLGIPFEFNPDPQAVKDFRLGFGDQSVTIYFSPRDLVENVSHYYIYFSYDREDLLDLPTSESELSAGFESLKRSISLENGKQIQSPIKMPANTWTGRYRVGPISNDRPLFVRVQVVSTAGKFSTDNEAPLAESPAPTKTLPQALGGAQSCGAHPATDPSLWGCIVGFFFIFLGFVRAKKIGPSV